MVPILMADIDGPSTTQSLHVVAAIYMSCVDHPVALQSANQDNLTEHSILCFHLRIICRTQMYTARFTLPIHQVHTNSSPAAMASP